MTQETTGQIRDYRLYLECCGRSTLVGGWLVFGQETDGPVYADGSAMKRCPSCNARTTPTSLRGGITRKAAARMNPTLF